MKILILLLFFTSSVISAQVVAASACYDLIKRLEAGLSERPLQQTIARTAARLLNRDVQLKMNNDVSIEGRLSRILLNSDGGLAYVQFSGPTRIKNRLQVIPGQDHQQHHSGYGMPVGVIKGFGRSWYKKEFLSASGLSVGQTVKLEYESGVVVDGRIENMSFDAKGDLTILSFTAVTVDRGTQNLFDRSWGTFDLAAGDFVSEIQVN